MTEVLRSLNSSDSSIHFENNMTLLGESQHQKFLTSPSRA